MDRWTNELLIRRVMAILVVLVLGGCCAGEPTSTGRERPGEPGRGRTLQRCQTVSVAFSRQSGPKDLLGQIGEVARQSPVPILLQAELAAELSGIEGVDLDGQLSLPDALEILNGSVSSSIEIWWLDDYVLLFRWRSSRTKATGSSTRETRD